LLVAGSVWVAATVWEVLLANNPVYPVTLAIAAVIGVVLIVTGLRADGPPRGGALRTVLRWAGALGGVGVAATLLWSAPFPAAPAAMEALASDDAVQVTDTRDSTVFEPAEAQGAGFVLYPGALVDPRAYAVLARDIAELGHPVVVVKCPFDIGFLCIDAAAPIVETRGPWAVGGHSLGGVAASQFAAGDGSGAAGLVFWASYPLGDLSDRDDLAVASISGSEDGLSTPADIDASRPNLPAATTFVEVEGATHAFFGDYGEQPGDGTATVERAEAQEQIVEATVALLVSLGAPTS
jgi:hypothetical protein